MKKICLLTCIMIMTVLSVAGCGKKAAVTEPTNESKVVLSDSTKDAIDELYSIQLNYSNGTAPLLLISDVLVKELYDNWDDIVSSGNENAPISLREYVDPAVVYFDYSTDYSIKWSKDDNDIVVEKTDIDQREDYKQKMHK